MNPEEQNVFKTLNLLMMLSRSRQQFSHGLTDEEKATLFISKQILADSGLTVPELANSLQRIAKKGYIWHMVLFDEHLRSQINEFIDSDQYHETLEKLSKELDNKEVSEKLHQAIIDDFSRMIPPSVHIDPSEDEELPKFTELFNGGLEVFKKLRLDEIGFVLLMPFRDTETLYQKIGAGEKFDDIQDDGFWYDNKNLEFHIDGEVIKTSYQNKPNLVHIVLNAFFSKPDVSKVEYEEMVGFDITKGNNPYRDAMRKFVKKHPKLNTMFSVHEYHTEFHPDKYEHIP